MKVIGRNSNSYIFFPGGLRVCHYYGEVGRPKIERERERFSYVYVYIAKSRHWPKGMLLLPRLMHEYSHNSHHLPAIHLPWSKVLVFSLDEQESKLLLMDEILHQLIW